LIDVSKRDSSSSILIVVRASDVPCDANDFADEAGNARRF